MHPTFLRRLVPLAAAVALAGGAVAQQDTSAPTQAQARTLTQADTGFMNQAAQNGLTEVEASLLAQRKASNEAVKAFAKQMVADHTKANDELKALAARKGHELPTEPSLRQKAQIKLLSAMDGDRFDRNYAEQVGVAAHEETVTLFKKGARDAKDPDVKAFATKTLPKLEHHLEMARKLETQTAATGK